MVSIKSFILTNIFFIQGIQAYCIYNNLTDGIWFNARQINTVSLRSAFDKYIKAGQKECCHYTNKDCSFYQVRVDKIRFDGGKDNPIYHLNRTLAICTSGGALYLHGKAYDFYAECVDINGVSTNALSPFDEANRLPEE